MNNTTPVYHHHLLSLEENPFSIKRITFRDPFKFAHMHAGVELVALVSGSCSFFLGGTVYEMHQGDISFADSGIPHWHYSQNQSEVSAVIVNIRFETLLGASPVKSDHRLVLPFLSVRSGAFPVKREQDSLVHLLSTALVYNKEKKDGDLGAWAMILQVISELVQLTDNTADVIGNKKHTQINVILDAVRFIQSRFKEDIGLNEIASVTLLSTSRFSHLFTEIMQVSPLQYRNQLRISYAMQQLSISDHTIEQVAFDSGFESISQFRELFSTTTGLSPSRYRKLIAPPI